MARPPEIFPRQFLNWKLPFLSWPHILRLVTNNVPHFLFLSINGLILYNALVHPPAVGYDAGSHLVNIRILAEGRLPTPFDTNEYFSPPLPYALPALVYANGFTWQFTQKFAQLLNVFLSLGTIYALVRLTRLIRPEQTLYTAATLAILALMPVYYKSFAFIRGEPWVTLFSILITYEVLSITLNGDSGRKLATRSVRLGIWLGLAVLSRQWGFLIWVSVVLFLLGLWWRRIRSKTLPNIDRVEDLGSHKLTRQRQHVIHVALLSSATALMIGGWFYLHLHLQYKSIAAFNRPLQPTFSLSNHPPSFYSGLGNGKLFIDPIRPSFPNQLWPKLYAEFWGDYEAYFLIFGRDLRTGNFLTGHVLEEALAFNPAWLTTNREQMAAYLGRANLIALGMTTFLLAALVYGSRFFWYWLRNNSQERLINSYAFIWLTIFISLAGYFAFLIMVPNPGSGDTIKATYLLHTYPLFALLTAELMEVIYHRTKIGYSLVWMLITLTYLYLIPTFLSRYVTY